MLLVVGCWLLIGRGSLLVVLRALLVSRWLLCVVCSLLFVVFVFCLSCVVCCLSCVDRFFCFFVPFCVVPLLLVVGCFLSVVVRCSLFVDC